MQLRVQLRVQHASSRNTLLLAIRSVPPVTAARGVFPWLVSAHLSFSLGLVSEDGFALPQLSGRCAGSLRAGCHPVEARCWQWLGKDDKQRGGSCSQARTAKSLTPSPCSLLAAGSSPRSSLEPQHQHRAGAAPLQAGVWPLTAGGGGTKLCYCAVQACGVLPSARGSPRGGEGAASPLLVAEHKDLLPGEHCQGPGSAAGRTFTLCWGVCRRRRRKVLHGGVSPAVPCVAPCRASEPTGTKGIPAGGCHSGRAVVVARALNVPPQPSRALGSQTQHVGRFGKDLANL